MTVRINRRTFGLGALAGLPLLGGQVHAQAALPGGTITLVVPFAAGGATDVVGRLLSQKVGEIIGRNVIVENVGGAGGAIGTARVAKAAPDGATLLLGTVSTHAIVPNMQKAPQYDPIRDFTPISNIAIVPNILLVSNDFPAKSVKELITLLKANPGKHSYASSGVGSTLHLSGEMFKQAAGVDMQHVPYRGGGPAMNDLISGKVPIMFDVLSGAAGFIKGGSVRALAIATKTRSPAFPDVPTIDESGLPGFETFTWNAVYGPANMPKATVDALAAAFRKAVADPDLQRKLKDLSAIPVGSSPQQLAEFTKAEYEKMKPVVATVGLKID